MTTETGVVYCVVDPDTREPKYVGATIQDPQQRLYQLRSQAPNKEMREWINELEQDGETPDVEVLQQTSVDALPDAEAKQVQRLGAEHELFNVQCGGGGHHTDPRENAAPAAYQFSEDYHGGDPPRRSNDPREEDTNAD